MIIILNYRQFIYLFLPAIVLSGWISDHLTVSHTVCWQFPNGWLFQPWLNFSLSHTKQSNKHRDQSANTQRPCEGGIVSWFCSFGGKNKNFITQLVCQNKLPPPLSHLGIPVIVGMCHRFLHVLFQRLFIFHLYISMVVFFFNYTTEIKFLFFNLIYCYTKYVILAKGNPLPQPTDMLAFKTTGSDAKGSTIT